MSLLNRSHISPTLLVLIYSGLVIAGLANLLFDALTVLNIVALILNGVTLGALLLIGGAGAREIGIKVSWLRIGLGGVLILLGIWEVITLNILGGLIIIVLGALVGVALGFWTIKVLVRIDSEASMSKPSYDIGNPAEVENDSN